METISLSSTFPFAMHAAVAGPEVDIAMRQNDTGRKPTSLRHYWRWRGTICASHCR